MFSARLRPMPSVAPLIQTMVSSAIYRLQLDGAGLESPQQGLAAQGHVQVDLGGAAGAEEASDGEALRALVAVGEREAVADARLLQHEVLVDRLALAADARAAPRTAHLALVDEETVRKSSPGHTAVSRQGLAPAEPRAAALEPQRRRHL